MPTLLAFNIVPFVLRTPHACTDCMLNCSIPLPPDHTILCRNLSHFLHDRVLFCFLSRPLFPQSLFIYGLFTQQQNEEQLAFTARLLAGCTLHFRPAASGLQTLYFLKNQGNPGRDSQCTTLAKLSQIDGVERLTTTNEGVCAERASCQAAVQVFILLTACLPCFLLFFFVSTSWQQQQGGCQSHAWARSNARYMCI